MTETIILILEVLIKGAVIVGLVQTSAAVSVYLERKISAVVQDRIGPNRVGPWGMLQPIADVVKLFWKEDLVPTAVDGFFHRLAPFLSLGIALAVWAVVPFAGDVVIGGKTYHFGIAPDANIGVLFILAMTSVAVYGITLAGWSSNNKYSLLGGLRSSAQMISYELSMGMSVVAVVLISGTLSLNGIVEDQGAWGGWRWNVFLQPLGFIIFLVSAFAETNRAPFDLPEAEPELVGGFNTEYSGMKFGMFFLAEYANMAMSAAFITLLYFGGWQLPFAPESIGLEQGSILLALVQMGVFIAKVMFWIVFFIWVRWSIPRFRYDQLMTLGWKVLLPLSLLNVLLTALGVVLYNMYFAA
jgi:NADH-quinone oxidoreductase subunit H